MLHSKSLPCLCKESTLIFMSALKFTSFLYSYLLPGCLVRTMFLGGETMLTELDQSPQVDYNFHKPLILYLATSYDLYRSVTLLFKGLIS
jgi:hypothetical protein